MATPPAGRFRVGFSGEQLDVLARGAAWAVSVDRRDVYIAPLKEIDFRLRCDADEWGESRETLSTLGILMRCGTAKMITVLYGVDVVRLQVYVKQVRINKTICN